MKTQVLVWLLSSIALLATGCSGGESKQKITLDNSPQVATFEQVGQNQVMVAHLNQLNDTLDIPLSAFIEDLRIIPLDNRDEALTKLGNVTVSPNYFLVKASQQAVKLFDKEGNFIADVGSVGQGPGEYQLLYDEQIDEENNRIYLLPWQSQSILAYDLQGKYQHSIPLAARAPKGVFHVDTKAQRVVVGILPFAGGDEKAPFVWQQDFEGNVVHQIDAKPYSIVPDFNNEVMSNNNVSGIFDFSIYYWVPRADSLYHYEPEAKQLVPVFTVEQPSEMIAFCKQELPSYYLLSFVSQTVQTEFGTQAMGFATALIDKVSGKGAYVRAINDLLNNQPMDPFWIYAFSNGYYTACYDPGDLIEIVENALAKPEKLTLEQKANLETLQGQLDDNDNTYLFIGKLRQGKVGGKTTVTILPRKGVVKQEGKAEEETKVNKESYEDEMEKIWHTPTYVSKDYLRENNRYKDWPKEEEKVVIVKAAVEKDGTVTDLGLLRSCGVEKLDREAVRLIQDAKLNPAVDKSNQPVRAPRILFSIHFPPQ